jgi:hypothetical protein
VGSTIGAAYQSHASPSGDNASTYEGQTAYDARPLVGSNTSATTPGFVLVSGNVWSITYSGIADADDFAGLNRKIYATAASSGPHPLIDISGPGSVIAAAALYTYCIPRAGGECAAGSSTGQIYINVPGLVYPWCQGSVGNATGENAQANDVCITNSSAVMGAGVQFSTLQHDPLGQFQRVLARVMTSPAKMASGFQNLRALPDNSWAMFQGNYVDGLSRSAYMVKIPPFPPSDTVVRSGFIPVPVILKPPASVNNVIVQFGYAEYGGNCTTRNDKCDANAATIPGGNLPFLYASEAPAGLACSSGCTVMIPAIPQRVLYYTVLYRNASNVVITTLPTQVLVTP